MLSDTIDSLIDGEFGIMNFNKQSKSTKRQRTKSSHNKENQSWQKQCQSNLDDFVLVSRRKGKRNKKPRKLDSDIDTESEDYSEDTLDEHFGDFLEQFPEIPEDLEAEYKEENRENQENQESLCINTTYQYNTKHLATGEREHRTTTMTDTVQRTDSVRQSPQQSSQQSQESSQSSQISPLISQQITPQQSRQLQSQQQSQDTGHVGGILATQLDSHGSLLKQILDNQQQMQSNISKLDAHLCSINQRITEHAASIHDLEQRVVRLEANEPSSQVGSQVEKLHSLEDRLNFMERKQRERNIRLIGIPENQYENCYDIVLNLTQELQLYVNVEVAHRTGRPGQQRPRHIIARVSSVQEKLDILRAQKHFLKHKAYFFVEDLTKKDYESKRALKPVIDKARHEGKRWRFTDGKLYVDGERIVADSVQPAVHPITSMGLAEDYGTNVQTNETPHQASTAYQPMEQPVQQSMEQLSQTPNQPPNQQVAFQHPHPHPSYQPEQQNRQQVQGQQQQQQHQHQQYQQRQQRQQDQPRLQQDQPRQELQQHQQQQLQLDRPWQQQQGQQQQGQQQLQQHPAPRFTREQYRHRQPQQPPQAWKQPQSTGAPFVPKVR